MSQLLKILAAVADLLRLLVRKRESREHDDKIQAVRHDPAEFLSDHFSVQPTSLPDNASDTDKTGSERAKKQ